MLNATKQLSRVVVPVCFISAMLAGLWLTHLKVILTVASIPPPLEAGHRSEIALFALGSTASEYLLSCLLAVSYMTLRLFSSVFYI